MLQASAVCHSSHCPSLPYFEKITELLFLPEKWWARWWNLLLLSITKLGTPSLKGLGFKSASTEWAEHKLNQDSCLQNAQKINECTGHSESETPSNNIPQSWTPCPVTSLQLNMLYFNFCMKMLYTFNQLLHSTPQRCLHFSGKWGVLCLLLMHKFVQCTEMPSNQTSQ